MHQTTCPDDPTATAPTLNPPSKGVTPVSVAKKLPATLNPKPAANTATKGPTITNPITKPPTIPNQGIFDVPINNNLVLATIFKGILPLTSDPSIARSIITSQSIPTVSATIKRPDILRLSPLANISPKRYTSPLKRPANINNAKNLLNAYQCTKTKLINAQTNTREYPKGIVIKDSKAGRKRSIVDKDEGPPNKKILDEDGEICPVCFESCRNSGDHRLVALKCGHLFGAKCIETWLRCSKKCPICSRRAIFPDLRNIYARKLAASDPVEKPGVRSIGVRAVRRSRRRRRHQIVNPQSTNQCSDETL